MQQEGRAVRRELHLVALASSLRVRSTTRSNEAGAMQPTIRTSSWCDDLDHDQGLVGPQLRGADAEALVHEGYRNRSRATSGGFGRRARSPTG